MRELGYMMGGMLFGMIVGLAASVFLITIFDMPVSWVAGINAGSCGAFCFWAGQLHNKVECQ